MQFGYLVRVCQLRCPVDGEVMVSAPADWAMTGEGRYRRNEVDEGVYWVASAKKQTDLLLMKS